MRLTIKKNYDYYHVIAVGYIHTNPQWRSYVPGSQNQLATGLEQQVDVYRQLLYGHLAASKWQAQVKTKFQQVSISKSRAAFNRLGTRDTWEREKLLIAPRRYTYQLFTYFSFFLFKRKEFGGDHYYLPRPTGKFHNLVMPISSVILLLRSGIYKRKKKVTLLLLFRYIK